MRHSYLPPVIIPNKGIVFVSQVLNEVAEKPNIDLKHATTNHAQTIGVLEPGHATNRTSLKMISGEKRKQWLKRLPIAILNYHKTHPSSIDYELSQVFQGRIPHNNLDHQQRLRYNPNIAPKSHFWINYFA